MPIRTAHELCSAVGELSCGGRKDPVEHRFHLHTRLQACEIRRFLLLLSVHTTINNRSSSDGGPLHYGSSGDFHRTLFKFERF